jgi:LSD1 subclass zinc finger protein
MTTAVAEPASDFVVECSGCRQPLAVRRDSAGRAVRCPECRAEFLVPPPELPTADGTLPPARSEAMARPAADAPTAFELPDLPPPEHAEAPGPAFQEPVKTLQTPTGTIVLRRLTPEEKAQRRARRNLILLLAGAMLLFVFVILFGR